MTAKRSITTWYCRQTVSGERSVVRGQSVHKCLSARLDKQLVCKSGAWCVHALHKLQTAPEGHKTPHFSRLSCRARMYSCWYKVLASLQLQAFRQPQSAFLLLHLPYLAPHWKMVCRRTTEPANNSMQPAERVTANANITVHRGKTSTTVSLIAHWPTHQLDSLKA